MARPNVVAEGFSRTKNNTQTPDKSLNKMSQQESLNSLIDRSSKRRDVVADIEAEERAMEENIKKHSNSRGKGNRKKREIVLDSEGDSDED